MAALCVFLLAVSTPLISIAIVASASVQDLPASVDWSNITGPVQNQAQSDSSVGIAVADCLRAFYTIKDGKSSPKLSTAELEDCVKPQQSPDLDWKFIANSNGLCTAASYPSSRGQCEKDKCSPIDPIKGYVNVNAVGNSTALQYALLSGPVVVGVEADQVAFQEYTGGILDGLCGDKIDHIMLLVGYGVTSSGDKYWKCQNSWGSSWGEDGYIRLCRDCDKNDGQVCVFVTHLNNLRSS